MNQSLVVGGVDHVGLPCSTADEVAQTNDDIDRA